LLQTGIAGLGDQLPGTLASRYERHRPEQTLLYQIVDKHYPDFLAQLATGGKSLPDHVQQEFTDFLKCDLLEYGFMQHIHVLHPCGAALSCASRLQEEGSLTGAVALIQRFGSALNLNIHFHMLFLDGVYVRNNSANFAFHYITIDNQSW